MRAPKQALRSVKVRLFLVCWIVYSAFFATNVVREHYPAFALIDRGDWVCDRYEGMHWDLFRHTDGHVYSGNNVLGSLIAVPVLFVFDPLLDALEERSKAQLAASGGEIDTSYDTKYPLRQAMFRKVKLAGLDLRFGASTAITSAFLMAPLSALLVVWMYATLVARKIAESRAAWLALLFAFATPVFYRSAHLNHNVFLMAALFGAFLLLWRKPGESEPLSVARRAGAGFLCGVAIALDYAGVIPAAVLALYALSSRARTGGVGAALRESVPSLVAAIPPVLFLLGTQWAMYGDPFTPGQFVMPRQNEFVDIGARGIAFPSPEIFLKNLVSPSWGLVPFAPLLLFALVPPSGAREDERVLPRAERRWTWMLALAFLAFCAMNVYSLLQFNTGFRYLLPLVPFLFLLASDALARLERRWLAALTVAVFAHSAVLSMTREVSDTENDLRKAALQLGVNACELDGYWTLMLSQTPVPASYVRLVREGPQLPWLTVLHQTSPGAPWLGSPWLALALIAATAGSCTLIWRAGRR
jgi:4-amino-4-deoxy-L-arabinose transferase-like glycosyltransferase